MSDDTSVRPPGTTTTSTGTGTDGNTNADGIANAVGTGDLDPGYRTTPGLTFASDAVQRILSGYWGRIPGIAGPSGESSNDEWTLFMETMTDKLDEEMARTTQEGLNNNQKKLDVESARQVKQTQDWHHQCMKAKHHSKWGKVMHWAMAVGACVLAAAAIGLTALSFGAATPLAVAAVAFATYAFAAQVTSTAGGPDIGVESNLTKGIVQGLKKAGVSDKNAMIAAIVIQGVLMIASMVAAGKMGSSQNMARLGELGQALLKYGSKAQMVAQFAEGSVSAGNGGMNIQVADDQHAAGVALAQGQYTQANMTDLNSSQQQLLEAMKAVMALMAAAYACFADILAARQQSGAQLIQAMAPVHG